MNTGTIEFAEFLLAADDSSVLCPLGRELDELHATARAECEKAQSCIDYILKTMGPGSPSGGIDSLQKWISERKAQFFVKAAELLREGRRIKLNPTFLIESFDRSPIESWMERTADKAFSEWDSSRAVDARNRVFGSLELAELRELCELVYKRISRKNEVSGSELKLACDAFEREYNGGYRPTFNSESYVPPLLACLRLIESLARSCSLAECAEQLPGIFRRGLPIESAALFRWHEIVSISGVRRLRVYKDGIVGIDCSSSDLKARLLEELTRFGLVEGQERRF